MQTHPIAIVFDYNRTIYNPENENLMPGALELLTYLKSKGIALFLIAKGDDARRQQIELLGLHSFFKKVIVNDHKSSEDFQSCIQECPEGTVFFAVGDRVKEEIRHANICGMTTIWLRNGKFASEQPSTLEESPKYTISALSEVIPIIGI